MPSASKMQAGTLAFEDDEDSNFFAAAGVSNEETR